MCKRSFIAIYFFHNLMGHAAKKKKKKKKNLENYLIIYILLLLRNKYLENNNWAKIISKCRPLWTFSGKNGVLVQKVVKSYMMID